MYKKFRNLNKFTLTILFIWIFTAFAAITQAECDAIQPDTCSLNRHSEIERYPNSALDNTCCQSVQQNQTRNSNCPYHNQVNSKDIEDGCYFNNCCCIGSYNVIALTAIPISQATAYRETCGEKKLLLEDAPTFRQSILSNPIPLYLQKQSFMI